MQMCTNKQVGWPTPTHFRSPTAQALLLAILVTLSASCQLDLVKFRRRTPAGWRGARAGSLGCETGCEDDAVPFPPTVAYKALSAGLALSVSSFLPVYLGPVVLPIVSQDASFASSKTQLHDTCAPSLCVSLPSLPLDSAFALHSVRIAPHAVSNAKEEVPGGFLPASS